MAGKSVRALFLAAAVLAWVCPAAAQDVTSPSRITTLVTSNPQWNTVTLTWTSVGDDLSAANTFADHYDVRYSTAVITEANFSSASQAWNIPKPLVTGKEQSMDVVLPATGTTYYFAMKVVDEAGNTSTMSLSPAEEQGAAQPNAQTSSAPPDGYQTLSACQSITQPGYYILTQDVTATAGDCFNIVAPNVTLDLNGHTVTYGYDFGTANPSFETGDMTGWTSTSPTTRVVDVIETQRYMIGRYALETPMPAGGWDELPQVTYTTDWITIPDGVKAVHATMQRGGVPAGPSAGSYPLFIGWLSQIEKNIDGTPTVVAQRQSGMGYDKDTFDYSDYWYPNPTVTGGQYRLKLTANMAYSGTHTGANGAAILTDATKDFDGVCNDPTWVMPAGKTAAQQYTEHQCGNILYGWRLTNLTTNANCPVLYSTSTTATCTLAGGSRNTWETGDQYKIEVAWKSTGTHTGASTQGTVDTLVDSNAHFGGGLGLKVIRNVTDGSSMTVSTTYTSTTIPSKYDSGLTGGTRNYWLPGDVWELSDVNTGKENLIVDMAGIWPGADMVGYNGVEISGSEPLMYENAIVKNGAFVQAAPQYSGFGVYCYNQSHPTVRNIHTTASGPVSFGMMNGNGGVFLDYCEHPIVTRTTADLLALVHDVSRSNPEPAIGTLYGNGNTLTFNTMYAGGGAICALPGDTIENRSNYCYTEATATNHHGIIGGGSGTVGNNYMIDNDIHANGAEGMMLSGHEAHVMNNHIFMEGIRPNMEYGWHSLDGIRVNDYHRMQDEISKMYIRNNYIHISGFVADDYPATPYPHSYADQININGIIMTNMSYSGDSDVTGNTIEVDVQDQYIQGSNITLSGGERLRVGGASSAHKWCESDTYPGVYFVVTQSSDCTANTYSQIYEYQADKLIWKPSGVWVQIASPLPMEPYLEYDNTLDIASIAAGEWYWGAVDTAFDTVYMMPNPGFVPDTASTEKIIFDLSGETLYEDNTLITNGVFINTVGYGQGYSNSRLRNNTFIRTGMAGSCTGWDNPDRPVSAGGCDLATRYSDVLALDMYMVDSVVVAGDYPIDLDTVYLNKLSPGYQGIHKQWTLDLTIMDGEQLVDGATVTIKDSTGDTVYTGTTVNGVLNDIELSEHFKWVGRLWPRPTETAWEMRTRTPHSIIAEKDGRISVATQITMNQPKALTVYLGDAPVDALSGTVNLGTGGRIDLGGAGRVNF